MRDGEEEEWGEDARNLERTLLRWIHIEREGRGDLEEVGDNLSEWERCRVENGEDVQNIFLK